MSGVKKKKRERETRKTDIADVCLLTRCTPDTCVALLFYLTFSISCSLGFVLVLVHAWSVWWPGKTLQIAQIEAFCTIEVKF